MSGSEQADDTGKSVEDLIKERDEAKSSYVKLTKAHDTLKADLQVAKASTVDAASLNKQLDKLIAEKSALMQQVEDGKTTLTSFKASIAKEKVKTSLSTALDEAGARNSVTAMKLIDMGLEGLVDENGNVVPDKIAEAISALKTSDPVLFKEAGEAPNVGRPAAPAVKHAADRVTQSAMETEMSNAKTQEEIMAVLGKYNTVGKAP